jgi:hypothetical protein
MSKAKDGQYKLQARVFWCPSDGAPVDWTEQSHSGLSALAGDAALALEIVRNCENLLRLLKTAADGKKTIDAASVKTLLDCVLQDFDSGGGLYCYLKHTGKLFQHASPLPPSPATPSNTGLRVLRDSGS